MKSIFQKIYINTSLIMAYFQIYREYVSLAPFLRVHSGILPPLTMVANDDHLQIFQNYEKLKKQIKNSLKAIFFKFNFKYEYFLV